MKNNIHPKSTPDSIKQVTSLASFYHGYARIKEGEREYYINRQGEKAFDALIPGTNAMLGNKDDIATYKESINSEFLPTKVIAFLKNGKLGVMSPEGEILLPAAYDSVGVENPYYWKLKIGNRVSFYLKGGNMLPFYEDIGYLDGDHFDVKQAGKWGIYSLHEQKLIVPAEFDAFDYCGGCGRSPSYVYASRQGKWGIIDWDGKELLPFIYEHAHFGMRSDNWVESFAKNGKRLIVHIPTKKEFLTDESGEYPKIVAGLLLFNETIKERSQKAKGTEPVDSVVRYGIYGQDGTIIAPAQYEWIDEPNANSYLGYDGSYFLAKSDGKTGVIDHTGTWMLPAEYDEVMVYDDYFVAKKNNQAFLFNKNQQELLKVDNADITHAYEYFYSSGSDGLAAFKIKQKAYYGLYFAKTAKYYPPEFYDIDVNARLERGDRNLVIGEKQGVLTVFDMEGNLLLPARYNSFSFLDELPDSLVKVERGKKVGLYNVRSQKEVISAVYEDFELIGKQNELLLTRKGPYDKSSYEFWNLQGHKIIDKTFSKKDTLNARCYLLQSEQDKNYSLFDVETQQIRLLNYPYVWTVGSSSLLLVSTDGRTGTLFDALSGKEGTSFYDVSQFNVELNGERNNNYPTLFPFQNGVAKVLKNGKYGFVDEQGKEFLSSKYAIVSNFNTRGIAVVIKGQEQQSIDYNNDLFSANFVDKQGRVLFREDYLSPDLQYSDFSELFLDDKILLFKRLPQSNELQIGLANAAGQVLLEPIYNDIIPIKNDSCFLLKKGTKFGLASKEGKMLVAVQYGNIGLGNNGFYVGDDGADRFPLPVFNDDKWFYINEEGERLPLEAASLDNLLY
ncbi:WG repeat-containing protein [Olivibacter sp. CPCC 100613]|uniref:WG repeat-containing protein n=1 Tax=Olivibacter sp. CPCC 100613 TaxID=3079931 RepID=UPI002FFBE8D9